MIKTLEQAIEKVKALDADRQQLAATVLEQIAASTDIYVIPDDELTAVLEGLAQVERGEFVSDAAADAAFRQPWR